MVDKHSPGIMFEMSMVAPGLSSDLGSGKSPISRFLINLAVERTNRAGEKRYAIYA